MNPDRPFWTSHDLCLYCDVGLAAVQAVLVLILQGEPGMEIASQIVKPQLLGIVGHGIGHGAIARALRQNDSASPTTIDMHQSEYEAGNFPGLSLASVPFFVFWVMLLRSALPKLSWANLAVMSVFSMLFQQFFPRNFGFTYVQSILMMAFGWNEMVMKPASEKGFEYAIFPWIVSVPLTMIGWLESTFCSKFVVRLGGHLVYDAYIPLATMCFYLICWLKASLSNATTKSSSSDKKTKKA
jgi:hypothetical protein